MAHLGVNYELITYISCKSTMNIYNVSFCYLTLCFYSSTHLLTCRCQNFIHTLLYIISESMKITKTKQKSSLQNQNTLNYSLHILLLLTSFFLCVCDTAHIPFHPSCAGRSKRNKLQNYGTTIKKLTSIKKIIIKLQATNKISIL